MIGRSGAPSGCGRSIRSSWAYLNSTPAENLRLTWWQRQALKELRRAASKPDGEPLEPEDWEVAWKLHARGSTRLLSECCSSLCRAARAARSVARPSPVPALVVRPLGYRPSRKNPTVCDVCVEASPPAG